MNILYVYINTAKKKDLGFLLGFGYFHTIFFPKDLILLVLK